MFASDKVLRRQIMSIVTDSKGVDEPKDPDGNTIFQLYSLFANPEERAALADAFRRGGLGYGDAKKALHEKVLAYFGPAREKRRALESRPDTVEDILRDGAKRARAATAELMDEVREAAGVGHRSRKRSDGSRGQGRDHHRRRHRSRARDCARAGRARLLGRGELQPLARGRRAHGRRVREEGRVRAALQGRRLRRRGVPRDGRGLHVRARPARHPGAVRGHHRVRPARAARQDLRSTTGSGSSR